MDWTQIVTGLASVYGFLALLVKVVPTISTKFPWLITIMKIIGKITNRQTDDEAIRNG